MTLVVPCFNEASRFDADAWLGLAGRGLRLLLVDDGSTDETGAALEAARARAPASVTVLRLESNQGKGEAIRRGFLRALEGDAAFVGFADADLATPPDELARLAEVALGGAVDVVLGSRVSMLGASIQRRGLRHYLGRIFATAASLALDEAVYDSQCGAKFFRAGPALREAMARPFASRWGFDVELLGRLRVGSERVPGLDRAAFLEVPLRQWTDVPGSHLRLGGMLRAVGDLSRVAVHLRAHPGWLRRP